MSIVLAFPDVSARTPVRSAILDFVAQAGPRPAPEAALGDEEQAFLDALRRIVARTPAEELLDKYRGSRSDSRSRIFARYAD